MFDSKLKTALLGAVIATNLSGVSALAAHKTEKKSAEETAKPEIALASTGNTVVSTDDTVQAAKQKRDHEDLKKSVSRYVADFYVSAY